jgi:methionine-rich copper-binding protein CopC
VLLVIAVLVALGGQLAMASTASAHNVLRSTSPADASTVDRVPPEVVLTFDEPALAMGTAMIVTGPAGEVQTGPARLVDNTVAQSIGPDAPAGTYTVQWRVTSADGHPISGTFGFTAVKAGGGSAAPTTGPSSGTSSPASVPSAPAGGVPGWLWPVIAVMLLLSALASTLIARRRRRR